MWQGWNGNEMYFFYDNAGTPVAFWYFPNNGGSRITGYYLTNQQGDVVRIEDPDGNVLASYSYNAWGRVYACYGSMEKINPLRYRGYYCDDETGFYYLQNRYYDPGLSRFINADSYASTGQGFLGYNMFAYCGNNPVNRADAAGNMHMMIEEFGGGGPSVNGAGSNSLPKKGDPGSSQTLPNPDGTPKQKRWYGPDGNPERDRDYNHPGDMPFPHDHKWENGERGKEHLPLDPTYKMNWEPVMGVGLVVICVVGIIVVAADDATGIGVTDDFLFEPLGAGVAEGLIMIFG